MDAKLKQQLSLALVFFNFTLLGYVLYKWTSSAEGLDLGQLFVHAAIGAGLGLVTGAIGYFVGGIMNK